MTPGSYTRSALNTEPTTGDYGSALGRLFAPREMGSHSQTSAWMLRFCLTTLRRFSWEADRLDRVKKALIYGKPIEWTDGEVADGHTTRDALSPSPMQISRAEIWLPGKGIRILHALLGICTEAGELADAVVKGMLTASLDQVNVAEEVGDIFWYVAILLDALGIPWEPVFRANILKLAKRFPQKFTGQDAILRDVGQERTVLEEALAGAAVDFGDAIGSTSPPARYNRDGERETIDTIRDFLGDEDFVSYCLGQVLRYTARAGEKDPTAQDLAKAGWYRQMALHVQSGGVEPDPRTYRGGQGYHPYVRQPFPSHLAVNLGLQPRESDTGIYGINLPGTFPPAESPL